MGLRLYANPMETEKSKYWLTLRIPSSDNQYAYDWRIKKELLVLSFIFKLNLVTDIFILIANKITILQFKVTEIIRNLFHSTYQYG